jgi:hypothetical protein
VCSAAIRSATASRRARSGSRTVALNSALARLRIRTSFTLIDLRPIRPLVFGARHKALDADLVRVIHGFDSLLVLSGSNPSQNL